LVHIFLVSKEKVLERFSNLQDGEVIETFNFKSYEQELEKFDALFLFKNDKWHIMTQGDLKHDITRTHGKT
jgi:hypothetical protein